VSEPTRTEDGDVCGLVVRAYAIPSSGQLLIPVQLGSLPDLVNGTESDPPAWITSEYAGLATPSCA
jgi:hypothetical protein